MQQVISNFVSLLVVGKNELLALIDSRTCPQSPRGTFFCRTAFFLFKKPLKIGNFCGLATDRANKIILSLKGTGNMLI